MSDATRELSTLARAVEANQAAWIKFGGRLPDVRLHRDHDVTWTCSRVPGRPNSVAMARFSRSRADARIAAMLSVYRACGSHIVWWVGPSSTPTDLPLRLRDAGFHCFKHFPGMAVDLANMARPFPSPRGLKIRLIDDFSIFEQHEHPFIGPITTERRRNMLENHELACAARPRRAWAFVATLDARPVGNVILFRGAGVAGIYDVGVIRKFRRRGIGTAVLLAALRFARDRGLRHAVLQASGEGESVYRRIGFEEVCRISLWFYSKRHHDQRER